MSIRTILIGLAIALALVVASRVLAQGGIALLNWTVDGGGGMSSGAPYALSATIGQPDASVLAGGNFRLSGGFWSAEEAEPTQDQETLFLPAITTQNSR